MNAQPPIRILSSLRGRILLLALLVCLLLGSALAGFFLLLERTESTIVGESSTHLLNAVNSLARDYTELTRSNAVGADQGAMLNAVTPEADRWLALVAAHAYRREPGIEGGFYSKAEDDLLGYAFPTTEGPGPKRDIPPRERPTIAEIARQAASTGAPASTTFRGAKDVILFQAVPIRQQGVVVGSAWGMQRIPGVDAARDIRTLLSVSCFALAAMACVAIAFWITRNVQSDVSTIQTRLQAMEQDLSGAPVRVLRTAEMEGIMRDIDRLGHTLAQKIAAEQELVEQLHHKERLASLGQVAAGVAHELRNPLATIRLRTQMSRRGMDAQEMDRSAAMVLEEIDRLSSVLDRLLYFAKPVRLQLQRFDLRPMCAEIVAHLQPEAERSGVTLRMDDADAYAGDPTASASLTGDPLKLRQVMENLIRNAIEAFAATPRDAKWVRLSIVASPGAVRVRVQDNGVGIAEDAAAHLFDPFFTIKDTGTGLGLSIAKEIVVAHGGELRVHNDAAGGAVAELTLPRAAPDAGGHPASLS